jgi:hypothetical protein
MVTARSEFSGIVGTPDRGHIPEWARNIVNWSVYVKTCFPRLAGAWAGLVPGRYSNGFVSSHLPLPDAIPAVNVFVSIKIASPTNFIVSKARFAAASFPQARGQGPSPIER